MEKIKLSQPEKKDEGLEIIEKKEEKGEMDAEEIIIMKEE